MRVSNPITNEDQLFLDNQAIDAKFARENGVRTAIETSDLPYSLEHLEHLLPGLIFPLARIDGEPVIQFRPNNPETDADGRTRKYLQEPNTGAVITIYNASKDKLIRGAETLLLTEGTKQTLAAQNLLQDDPQKVVVGIQGCWGWVESGTKKLAPDLLKIITKWSIKRVVVLFDKDISTNGSVWSAASALKTAITDETLLSSKVVRFATLPGAEGTDGLDDVFGRMPVSKRLPLMESVIQKASAALPSKPERMPSADEVNGAQAQVDRELVSATKFAWSPHRLPPGSEQRARSTSSFPLTQLGVAQRWATLYTESWRSTDGMWRTWSGQRWEEATEGALKASVVTVIEKCVGALELSVLLESVSDTKERMEIIRDRQREVEFMGSSAFISGVVSLLPALEGFEISEEAWDKDKHLLNTPSGVRNLKTLELIPHESARELYCTRITAGSGLETEPTQDLKFILETFAKTSPSLPEFIQMVAGVAVSGKSARLFVSTFGVPNAGKSTFFSALAYAMGMKLGRARANSGYATGLGTQAIAQTKGSAPNEDLWLLSGRRFGFIDDTDGDGMRLDQGLIKKLASGDHIRMRQNHGQSLMLESSATLVVTGNVELSFSSTDKAIRDRFYPIKLTYEVPDVDIDPELKDRVRRDQRNLDSVLWFAILGAKSFYDRGGSQTTIHNCAPQFVLNERQRYLNTSNPLAGWFEMFYEDPIIPEEFRPTGPQGLSGCSTLQQAYTAYTNYVEKYRVKFPCGLHRFPEYLEAYGLSVDAKRSTPSGGGPKARYIRGLRALNTDIDQVCSFEVRWENLTPAEQAYRDREGIYTKRGGATDF